MSYLDDLLDPNLTDSEFARRRAFHFPTARNSLVQAVNHPTYFGKVPNAHRFVERRDRQLIDADEEAGR